ncbi:hypothetical protein GCM10007385_35490 [Tateyamaria omphalii]|uniref:phage minor head protein n=1 Tax=Tateyamaria omphalii TaxID=299262 RepID=UPI0016783B66|nr:phage minor head protein [Tateyamaria omphalii]GGX63260.1 hypothetical protein GCM10007385_35490 [Tateyamaria omphalii]
MARQTLAAFQAELAKIEPTLARAFAEAMADVRSTAQRDLIIAAIERGDVEGVVQAIRLGREFFAPLDARIEDAFRQGAIWQLTQLPKKAGPEGTNLIVRFDQRNPRAEQWTRDRGARFISEVTEDQRTLVRETVQQGIADGAGADKIARRLIGTTQGNQRKGGVIGLHSKQASAVARARDELSDPASMRGYLRRKRRDGRFDRTVLKAIREERALSSREIDKITGRYADRLLQTRGRRIARTEAHNAFSAGRNEAVMQMVDSGQVPPTAVKLVWQSTPSLRTRDTHRAMNGQEVPFGIAFQSPSGALMMYPGDGSLGAPAEELVNCRCGVRPEIDFVSLAR